MKSYLEPGQKSRNSRKAADHQDIREHFASAVDRQLEKNIFYKKEKKLLSRLTIEDKTKFKNSVLLLIKFDSKN